MIFMKLRRKTRRLKGVASVVAALMLLAVIVAFFGMLSVHYVPAKGADEEASHMRAVFEQLAELKSGADALMASKNFEATRGVSIPLGTEQKSLFGGLMPSLNPTAASGTLRIRSDDGMMTVSADAKLVDETSESGTLGTQLEEIASNVLAVRAFTLTLRGVESGDFVEIEAVGEGGAARICINGTPAVVFFGIVLSTDITVTVWNGSMKIIDSLPVYRDVSGGESYEIDLLSSAYGFKQILDGMRNFTILAKAKGVAAEYELSYSYVESVNGVLVNTSLGSLEFSSHNNYWINQILIYQSGGLFVKQKERATYRLTPPVAVERVCGVWHVDVGVVKIIGTAMTAGSGGEEVRIKLVDVEDVPLLDAEGNAKWVNITVTSSIPDAWYQFFERLASQAAGGNSKAEWRGGNAVSLTIWGNNADAFDVRLNLTTYELRTHLSSLWEG